MIAQHWRLALTSLSPVHMGSGRDYEPTNYVIEDGALYAFDSMAALEALPESERTRLRAILEDRPNDVMLRQLQSFFYNNREWLMAASRHQVRVSPSIEAFYQERVGKVVQQETGGRNVQNKLEIERTAWNPVSDHAILPGSGIKGAVRTALLDHVNGGRPLPPELRGKRQANQDLQKRLFDGSFHRDPMRLVHIGDAALSDPESFTTEVRFALNRKKRAVEKNGTLLQSQAEERGLYQLLECVPALAGRAFEGALAIQNAAGVKSRDNWPKMHFDLYDIAAACNAFYRPILEAEVRVLRNRGFLDGDWLSALEHVLAYYRKPLDENHVFLVRVGRHSGAESVTLNGVRSIEIMKGKGKKPEYLDHSKTVWLAGDERQAQTGLVPFGWILVEPYRDDGELPKWPLETDSADLQAWRSKVRERLSALEQQLRQRRAREAEEAARRAAEEAERQAREAKLATMTEEQRKLLELREWYEEDRAADRKEPGGRLANRLAELLKEADGWDAPWRTELADLAEAIYGFIGWGSSKKKKERRERIEALRR